MCSMLSISTIVENANKRFYKPFIYEKVNGEYSSISYQDFYKNVIKLKNYCIFKGLKNNNIMVIGKNSINVCIADVAITGYVGICVNINCNTSLEELEEVVEFYNIKGILYTDEQEEKIKNIKNVVSINIKNALNIGDDLKDCTPTNKNENDCAKIVFSSGTTSRPKGVMLSTKNIFAGWNDFKERIPLNQQDKIYLSLPLNHTYANIYNFYYTFLSGASLYLSSGIKNMVIEFNEVNPTVFCSVPLIFENFLKLGLDIKKVFGNNIKYVFSGGAKLNPNTKQKYLDSGIAILEAYALTEVASSFTIERPNNVDIYGSGDIFDSIDVKIIKNNENDEFGKIVVKGDNVFLGYANNPELTKQSFTDDGYFITGDLGYLKGQTLYLIGRDKNVLISSNGENIYVDEIIAKLKSISQDINQIVLYLEEDKLFAKFYVNNNINIKEVVEKYNQFAIKQQRIIGYTMNVGNKAGKLLV